MVLEVSANQAQSSKKGTVARAQVERALDALGCNMVCADRPQYPFPTTWVQTQRRSYRQKQAEKQGEREAKKASEGAEEEEDDDAESESDAEEEEEEDDNDEIM